MYARHRFEYILSDRTDLNYRLTYEMRVGHELHESLLYESNRQPEPMALEDVTPTTGDDAAESELSEVVVHV